VASALVVGAGLAGLAAAHRLQSLGHRVTVLEARERPGGKHARATLSGVDYEPWPGVLPRSAPAFAELVGELGVADRVERTPLRAALVLRDGALRPVPLEVRAALRGSLLAPLRLRRYALLAHWLGGALDPDEPSRETRLDDRSVADFCQVYLGRRARDALFAPLFAGAFGLDARDARETPRSTRSRARARSWKSSSRASAGSRRARVSKRSSRISAAFGSRMDAPCARTSSCSPSTRPRARDCSARCPRSPRRRSLRCTPSRVSRSRW